MYQDFLAKQASDQRTQDINTHITALSQSSRIDQNILNDLAGLTGLDVQAASLHYGADVEKVNQLRKALGTAGILSMMSGGE